MSRPEVVDMVTKHGSGVRCKHKNEFIPTDNQLAESMERCLKRCLVAMSASNGQLGLCEDIRSLLALAEMKQEPPPNGHKLQPSPEENDDDDEDDDLEGWSFPAGEWEDDDTEKEDDEEDAKAIKPVKETCPPVDKG